MNGIYALLLLTLWLYRYVRFVVHCIAHWTFKPIPLPEKPTLFSDDVTVIIPTIDGDGVEFKRTVQTCLAAEPAEVILVTVEKNFKRVARAYDHDKRIRVMSVEYPNKRRQICKALPAVKTRITVLCDDDVIWPPRILHWMLAAFERPDIGGVGTCQRLLRAEKPNWWGYLAALYLERRNFEISATTNIDGGISCLSGRTVAYRTEILQSAQFIHDFQSELWGNKYQLNTDDDNFITRWMVSHNWKTYVQYCKEAELQTTLEDNPKFLRQCLRWARSNWRSNITSMFVEKHIWQQQPWSSYALHVATFTNWAFLVDSLLCVLVYKTFDGDYLTRSQALAGMTCWIVLTKIIKTMGHFIRYPEDIVLLPVSIIFGYLHGFIKLYALFTLGVTTWGSRDGADEADEERMKRIETAEASIEAIYEQQQNQALEQASAPPKGPKPPDDWLFELDGETGPEANEVPPEYEALIRKIIQDFQHLPPEAPPPYAESVRPRTPPFPSYSESQKLNESIRNDSHRLDLYTSESIRSHKLNPETGKPKNLYFKQRRRDGRCVPRRNFFPRTSRIPLLHGRP